MAGLSLALHFGNRTTSPSGERPLQVYCAAGLRKPVQEVLAAYTKEFGVSFETSFDGSGKLLGDLRAAGSGDIYIAADTTYMIDGQKYGLIREVAPIAYQHPCLAIRKRDAGDPSAVRIKSLEDLFAQEVQGISQKSKLLLRLQIFPLNQP